MSIFSFCAFAVTFFSAASISFNAYYGTITGYRTRSSCDGIRGAVPRMAMDQLDSGELLPSALLERARADSCRVVQMIMAGAMSLAIILLTRETRGELSLSRGASERD